MRKYNIKELLSMLDWRKPQSQQTFAMSSLIAWDDEVIYGNLLNEFHKERLPNIIQILYEVGYPKNKKSVDQLLELMMDVNWPGADKAKDVLLAMDRRYLVDHLENMIQRAYNERDDFWLWGLRSLMRKGNIIPEEFKNPDVIRCFAFIEECEE